MTRKRDVRSLLLAAVILALQACATLERGPVGNQSVPQPAKSVDLSRYGGLWYEIGRYENGFERGCEAVTAKYSVREDGILSVTNACREGGEGGRVKLAQARAKVVAGSGDARLKVSFFGPFYVGDYWVLDRADDYSWSIVGEPSGRYLWLLSRSARPSAELRAKIMTRAAELGYDLNLVHETRH